MTALDQVILVHYLSFLVVLLVDVIRVGMVGVLLLCVLHITTRDIHLGLLCALYVE